MDVVGGEEVHDRAQDAAGEQLACGRPHHGLARVALVHQAHRHALRDLLQHLRTRDIGAQGSGSLGPQHKNCTQFIIPPHIRDSFQASINSFVPLRSRAVGLPAHASIPDLKDGVKIGGTKLRPLNECMYMPGGAFPTAARPAPTSQVSAAWHAGRPSCHAAQMQPSRWPRAPRSAPRQRRCWGLGGTGPRAACARS